MTEGAMLKKITEAMKDLVTEANFDCSTTGISLQAMVRASACAQLTCMCVSPASMAPMSLRCPPRLRSVQPGSWLSSRARVSSRATHAAACASVWPHWS